MSSTASKLFNTNVLETQNILEIEQVIWPQCAWWPYDSKSCEARQETQREVVLENAVHALVDCLASWATKNWNIAHSRPENFIFIGLTPTTHSIKYVCILGTDLHYSNYLAHQGESNTLLCIPAQTHLLDQKIEYACMYSYVVVKALHL